MSQILHVFRKDIRHHWIEILLCQTALVAYCWNEVRGWSERSSFSVDALSTTIHALLPLTWGFFVFRVIQGESLVGDRQFWITRPYEWKKLLAEKVIMILTFINLPLLIAGAALLAKARFSPGPHVLGLLWMQLLILWLPFLPLLALAAVTRNLAQALLALLLVLLFFALNLAIEALLEQRGLSSGDTDWVLTVVLAIACCAAIGLQYSHRKTMQSRVWLGSGALVMILIVLAGAYVARGSDLYPLSPVGAPFHAGLAPEKLTAPKEPAEKDEDVDISLPLLVEGLPPGSLGRIRGVRLVLEAPDGYRWESGWQGYYLLEPGENAFSQSFTLKYRVYERMKSLPLKASVAVAVEVLREHDLENITAGAGEFVVPRVGRCRLRERQPGFLFCHSPLVKPAMVVMRTDPSQSTCPVRENDPQRAPQGIQIAWEPGRDSDLPDYGISPVVSFSIFFREAQICPGTPLSFSFPEFVENARSDFEIHDMKIDDYRKVDVRFDPFYMIH